MTRIYLLSIPSGGQARELVPRLPPWRREKTLRLRSETAFAASVGVGLLWRYAMEQTGLDPRQEVRLLPAGKPVLASGEAFFSLSHSGRWALCALGDGPLGADVQALRPARPSIARRFCPDEQLFLQNLPEPDRPAALLRLWARKEAWVKAESRDRMLALDEFSVLAPGPWRFSDFAAPDGSPVCLCSRDGEAELLTVDIQKLFE